MESTRSTVSGMAPADSPAVGLTSPAAGDAARDWAVSASKRPINSTAYRIFKMLAWLMQAPLSVDELNQRFLTDPAIARQVSSDSIWMYVNTLKALGCRIRRPCPSNAFRYELTAHPFGLQLSGADQIMLGRVKSVAQQVFSPEDVQAVDRMIKRWVRNSACESVEAVLDEIFAQSRSLDLEAHWHWHQAMEDWIHAQTLLNLTYRSPVKGVESFVFLPEAFLYEQGVLYLRGDRLGYAHPSSLRFDRLVHLEPVSPDASEYVAWRELLTQRRSMRETIRLQVFAPGDEAFDGLGLTQAHGVDAIQWRPWPDAGSGSDSGYDVILQVRDVFYVKQRLLASGFRFRVLGPESFREDMRATLVAMQQRYQEAEAAHESD